MPSECASARAPSTASGEQQALAPSVSRVGPELDRDADHLRPALARQQRGDGAVDAAGHGDERRARVAPGWPPGARAPSDGGGALPERRCSASVASCAAWRLAGVRPPIAASTVSMSIRAASSTGAPSTISATAAVAARVAPHPSASKVTRAIRPSSTTSEIRERSPQAAPPAAPVKRHPRAGPTPALIAQIVLEELPIHRLRVGGRRAAQQSCADRASAGVRRAAAAR